MEGTQTSLLPPAARNTDPAASHVAARALEPDRMKQVFAAVQALHRHPGLTYSELAYAEAKDKGEECQHCGCLPGAEKLRDRLHKRLADAAHMGFARRGEEVKCKITHKRAARWYPTNPQPAE